MIDVVHQIESVQRTVGSRVLGAGEARTVTLSQTYDATVVDVWDACTTAERIARWFLPVTGELRLGGHYQLEGNAGGVIETCDPPHVFTATWEYGGELSWIELHLSAADGGTRLELVHIAQVDDERWTEFGPGAVGVGWDLGLLGLAGHLASGEAVDPEQAAAWTQGDEGRRFMTLSSERWYDANAAAGAPVDGARAAADRTTAAYTGAGS